MLKVSVNNLREKTEFSHFSISSSYSLPGRDASTIGKVRQ